MKIVKGRLTNSVWSAFWAGLMAWMFAASAQAALEIEISGGSAIQIPIAILPMAEQANSQKSRLHEIISNDLRGSGMFRIINTSGMPAVSYTHLDVYKRQG